MSNYRTTVNEIVGRCRRVNWDVATPDDRRSKWAYCITPPGDHPPVYIHRTPSDVNWVEVTWRKLNAAGFKEAEAAWRESEAQRKAATLKAARVKAERKTAELAKRSAAIVQAAGKYGDPQEVDIAWLTTPADCPDTRTVIVTPAAAKLVLETMNTHNRRMSGDRVAYFEDVMRAGEWHATHQGVSIDKNGVLLDGQTRLQAIVNYGMGVPMMVSVGMDPGDFMRVDTGRTRSARDTAYVMGESNPAAISATARMLVVVEREGPNAYIRSRGHVPNERIAVAIETYGDPLRKAVKEATAIKRELPRANPSAVAAALYLIRQRLPEGDPRVEQFVEDLRYGERLNRGDPVLLLRRNLQVGPSDHTRFYDRWEVAALVLKAWNLRANGETRQSLLWRRVDPFPASVFLPPPPD